MPGSCPKRLRTASRSSSGNLAAVSRKRLNDAVWLAMPPDRSLCPAWLGKPVLYQLSYVRAARILAL